MEDDPVIRQGLVEAAEVVFFAFLAGGALTVAEATGAIGNFLNHLLPRFGEQPLPPRNGPRDGAGHLGRNRVGGKYFFALQRLHPSHYRPWRKCRCSPGSRFAPLCLRSRS